MADNYIEKKMEDMRSGKLARHSLRPTARKGVWCLDFPCRRVLVTDGACAVGRAVVDEFCRLGCKVAFFDGDTDSGMSTSYATGARFIHGDVRDRECRDTALRGLAGAWRDIDIVVNTVDDGGAVLDALADFIAGLREHLPYPNDFGGRIVDVVSDSGGNIGELVGRFAGFRMTMNRIVVKGREMPVAGIARLCVFLSAPGSGFVNGAEIPAGDEF